MHFFAAIFFLIVQISSSSFLPSTKGDFQKNVDLSFMGPAKKPHPGTKPIQCPSPKSDQKCNHPPQYLVIPQYNPTSGSMFANAPSVTLFTNTFLEAVCSTPILREVLDLSQTTAKQYSDYLTKYGEGYFSGLCIENAAALAEFAFRAVAPNFDVLTLPIVARFYANAAANFLFTDGVLRVHNAEDLALAYARAIVDSAKVTMTSDPTSKLKALPDGFVNFFDSLGLSTKEKGPYLSYYVGNEWFMAAVNYRWS
ncbi:hypothetical protein AVEN_161133-1 [Araneus ventricosus]|uniref:Uncharacterized protein n=1 Tax=Araneus ventricosus TaxID=182803 RepID=A0A4Y2K4K5_ARAVE|nr:hypothetical protein AVEN_161133-1 [Araneus ventricosus]